MYIIHIIIGFLLPKEIYLFAQHAPIVWESSDSNAVAKGIGTVYYTASYDSPCRLLRFNKDIKEELINRCEADFQDAMEEQLKKICKLSTNSTSLYEFISYGKQTGLERPKRFVGLIIGTVAVVWAVTISGVATYAVVKAKENSGRIEDNKAKIDAIEEQMRAVKSVLKGDFKTVKDMKNSLKTVEHLLISLNTTIYKKFDEIPLKIWDLSNAASEIKFIKMWTKEFARMFPLGKIYPIFWDHLGLNVPLIPDHLRTTPFNNIVPKSCELNTFDKTISINALVYDLSTDYLILYANPFVILNVTNKEYCPLEFIGPRYQMFSKKENCFVAVNENLRPEQKLFEPPRKSCISVDTSSKPDFTNWRAKKCIEKEKMKPRDFFQLKSVEKSYFIYCFPANITIAGVSMKCPNNVIQVDEGLKVSVDGDDIGTATVQQIGHINKYNPIFNQIANTNEFKDLNKYYTQLNNENTVLENDVNDLGEKEKELDKTFLKTWITDSLWKYSFYIVLILIAIVIGISAYFLFKRRQKNHFKRVNRNESQGMELNDFN